jgi:hypothetical protein
MILIPANRRPQPLFKGDNRVPSETLQFAAIDGIPAVVAWPIGDKPQQGSRFAQLRQNPFSDGDIFPFIAAADVINRTRHPMEKRMRDPGAMVFDCQPVASLSELYI